MNAESLSPSSFAIACIAMYSSPVSKVTTRIECCPHPFENMSGSQLIGHSKKEKPPATAHTETPPKAWAQSGGDNRTAGVCFGWTGGEGQSYTRALRHVKGTDLNLATYWWMLAPSPDGLGANAQSGGEQGS